MAQEQLGQLRAVFVVHGALAGRGRRASAGVGGTGKSAQSPRKEWQSLKADQETVPFSPKPAATIQKHAGLVHTGTVPRILLNWPPREGPGKGSLMESPLYLKRAGH